jgi:hypothetical protein
LTGVERFNVQKSNEKELDVKDNYALAHKNLPFSCVLSAKFKGNKKPYTCKT